tara:strand:+ start:7085 stop:7663 length:579 start_codon:yes stop_codon:yes gene_type:complete
MTFLTFAIFGLCVSWVFFISLSLGKSFFLVLGNFFFYYERLANELILIDGVPCFSWIMEAIFIIGFPIFYYSRNKLSEQPFCEVCDNWMKRSMKQVWKFPKRMKTLDIEKKVNRDGMKAFLNYEIPERTDTDYYVFDFYSCKCASPKYYLTVVHNFEYNAKGHLKLKSEELMHFYVLDSSFKWQDVFEDELE